MQRDSLVLSTCMAANMDYICQDLAAYLSTRLSCAVELIIDLPWQERERLLDAGEIDLCWLCGLPYVRKADQAPGQLVPLVAPVMQGERYQNRPVYFSDLVVRRDSPFTRLEELRCAVWAYNEPGSQSGYGVVRYALAERGETFGFFQRLVEAGSHQAALQMILKQEVDVAAIDSTVLEQELLDNPEIEAEIRVIDTFGPSPIPPWVVSRRVVDKLRQAVRDALTGMENDPQGRLLLNKARLARYVAVEDRDYDPIRKMDAYRMPIS